MKKPLPRLIPCLLLQNGGFYKTVKFKDPGYLGDPLNIVKIFNEKECDEIIVLDIGARRQNGGPNLVYLEEIAGECFMPLCYGGGISNMSEIERILFLGFEKVSLNTAAVEDPKLVTEAAKKFGSQAVVAAIDVKKSLLGRHEAYVRAGSKKTGMTPVELAKRSEDAGAGEILLNSIDRDGTLTGYDLDLIKTVAAAVSIPVIASGGARNLEDMRAAVQDAGASAAAAGAMFVYQGKHRAVLIKCPTPPDIRAAFGA